MIVFIRDYTDSGTRFANGADASDPKSLAALSIDVSIDVSIGIDIGVAAFERRGRQRRRQWQKSVTSIG